MTMHAKGTFDVHLTPQPAEVTSPTPTRLLIAKEFHGDLEATSVGQMLSAMTEVDGSAGYVAIERVSGTLGGRSGSFVLQHNGLMARGAPSLAITVVPDSGTEKLVGISGQMTIRIQEDKHLYEFEYTLQDFES